MRPPPGAHHSPCLCSIAFSVSCSTVSKCGMAWIPQTQCGHVLALCKSLLSPPSHQSCSSSLAFLFKPRLGESSGRGHLFSFKSRRPHCFSQSLNLIYTFPYPNSLLFPSCLPRPVRWLPGTPVSVLTLPLGWELSLTVQSLSFFLHLDGACRLERTVWAEDCNDSDFPNAIKYLSDFQRCKWMAVVLWHMEPGVFLFSRTLELQFLELR